MVEASAGNRTVPPMRVKRSVPRQRWMGTGHGCRAVSVANYNYMWMRRRWRVGPVCKTGARGIEGSNPSIHTLSAMANGRPSLHLQIPGDLLVGFIASGTQSDQLGVGHRGM